MSGRVKHIEGYASQTGLHHRLMQKIRLQWYALASVSARGANAVWSRLSARNQLRVWSETADNAWDESAVSADALAGAAWCRTRSMPRHTWLGTCWTHYTWLLPTGCLPPVWWCCASACCYRHLLLSWLMPHTVCLQLLECCSACVLQARIAAMCQAQAIMTCRKINKLQVDAEIWHMDLHHGRTVRSDRDTGQLEVLGRSYKTVTKPKSSTGLKHAAQTASEWHSTASSAINLAGRPGLHQHGKHMLETVETHQSAVKHTNA